MTAGFQLGGCSVKDYRESLRRPRVAVLIPCFNAEDYLPRALASLARNSEPHDIVMVDDGSARPLTDCIAAMPVNAIVIRLPQNTGITAALNIGLSLIAAEGYEYVARLDADDWSVADRLAKQAAFLDAHKHVALLGSWALTVDEDGTLLFENRPQACPRRLRRSLAYRNPIVHSSIMLRVTDVVASGGYNQSFRKAEDYELVRRMDAAGAVGILPEVLTCFQITKGSISSKRWSQVGADLRVKLLYFVPGSVHSYAGFLKTALSAFVPRSAIVAARALLSPTRRISAARTRSGNVAV